MIVIFDIDGTLSDPTHRRDHLKNRDWDTFFSLMEKDPPKREYCMLANIMLLSKFRESNPNMAVRNTLEVVFTTGRPSNYRLQTERWLSKHIGLYPVEYKYIYMRKAGDTRADSVVKAELLDQIKADFPKHDVKLVIDDRPSVVEMWKSKGFPVIVAPGWDREGFERPRKPTLNMMVGPSGAGKTFYCSTAFQPDTVISSDKMKEQLLGDFRDNSKNDLVFHAVHSQIKCRLELGLDAVMDVTNLRNRDRRAMLDKCPEDIDINYLVIDRPMEKKLECAGWRKDIIVKGQPLIEYHDNIFKSNLSDILAGDNDPRVTIVDLRERT